ncbi:MAG: DUF481 domain-containing protein [Gammaproteobacteria bacterium]|jgi:putative salt-induced outer membrane protein YdiY|nr:DUF481 domain-containing protein [Gammaproteobacteria bacterium]
MLRASALALLGGIMTITAGTLQADVLHLADGSRIVGTIERIDGAQATLSGTFAGDLAVPRDAIVSIETTNPVTVQLDTGAYLTGTLNAPEDGGIVVDVAETGSRQVPMSAVGGVYREDPLALQRQELAVRVTGNANVGITLNAGNSESENFHLDGRVVTRTKRNRYTLSGEYNEEESENVLVKQNWTGLVKYDHFVSEKWFWFSSATFENDEFADLNLRSALALGMGYQFFETDTRSLSVELGPSYIDENFETAPDESFAGGRWAVDYDQWLWDGIWFYHYNEGLLGLENTSNLTVRSRTGLRMNVTDRIIARVQTAIDWNNSPPEGAESTDYEHTLTIGYQF